MITTGLYCPNLSTRNPENDTLSNRNTRRCRVFRTLSEKLKLTCNRGAQKRGEWQRQVHKGDLGNGQTYALHVYRQIGQQGGGGSVHDEKCHLQHDQVRVYAQTTKKLLHLRLLVAGVVLSQRRVVHLLFFVFHFGGSHKKSITVYIFRIQTRLHRH